MIDKNMSRTTSTVYNKIIEGQFLRKSCGLLHFPSFHFSLHFLTAHCRNLERQKPMNQTEIHAGRKNNNKWSVGSLELPNGSNQLLHSFINPCAGLPKHPRCLITHLQPLHLFGLPSSGFLSFPCTGIQTSLFSFITSNIESWSSPQNVLPHGEVHLTIIPAISSNFTMVYP